MFLFREAIKLSRLTHPNVVRMYGVCLQGPIALLQDFVPRGSLQNILSTTTIELSWGTKIIIISFNVDLNCIREAIGVCTRYCVGNGVPSFEKHSAQRHEAIKLPGHP